MRPTTLYRCPTCLNHVALHVLPLGVQCRKCHRHMRQVKDAEQGEMFGDRPDETAASGAAPVDLGASA